MRNSDRPCPRSGNSLNGMNTKNVHTIRGNVDLELRRVTNGSFEPTIVPKRARNWGKMEDMIISHVRAG